MPSVMPVARGGVERDLVPLAEDAPRRAARPSWRPRQPRARTRKRHDENHCATRSEPGFAERRRSARCLLAVASEKGGWSTRCLSPPAVTGRTMRGAIGSVAARTRRQHEHRIASRGGGRRSRWRWHHERDAGRILKELQPDLNIAMFEVLEKRDRKAPAPGTTPAPGTPRSAS